MRKISGRLATLALATAALVMAAAPRANADTCATATGTLSSVTLCYTTSLTAGAGTITIDKVFLGTNMSDTGKIFVIALDTAGTISSIAGFTSGGSDCGSFSGTTSCFGAPGGIFPPITVNVSGIVGGSTSLEIHAGGFNQVADCSIKFSVIVNSTSGGTVLAGDSANCNSSGPPPVPEPGTLGLLGTGLVVIAGLVRRRLL